MSAAALERVITAMAGPDARPRPDQVTAVEALVEGRRRVLVVQATGWGKSAVYWAATAALRAAGAGPTLVVSPLLALMRDQIAAAARAGLRAATVNSTNVEEWDEVLAEVLAGRLDVLLISPERLSNPSFARRLPDLLGSVGMLVIDEAHCVSDWGFDFRPDYQRLTRTLLGLAPGTPVLATTATANQRVTADVADQLGDDTVTLRGSLARASLRLAVVPGLSVLDRYAWVADALRHLPGSGIVYVLTVAETERVAAFLNEQGLDVAAYSGQTTDRVSLEDRLRDNQIKALVATSALGMGYDKPDLAFCVHLGSPASPVAYYQQVGRAGRALDDALAVLVPAEADERIWEYFATSGIPDEAQVERILEVLADEPQSLVAVEAATGIRRGRLETVLKILAVDEAVERRAGGWVATGKPWYFDSAKWDALRKVRAAEADLMRAYAHGEGCLMQFLQQALDDPDQRPCGRCSVCTGELPLPGARPQEATVDAARRFFRGQDVVVEPRKQWAGRLPDRKGKITFMAPGRALAYADDPAWNTELATLWQADRPAPRGDPGRVGPGAGALVEGLGASRRRGCHAVPAFPHAGRLAGAAHRRGRPAAAGRRPRGERPAAERGQRLVGPGHRPALPHHAQAGRAVRRSGAAGGRHHADALDGDGRRGAAGRRRGHLGAAVGGSPAALRVRPRAASQVRR